jgi:hypothetical protein
MWPSVYVREVRDPYNDRKLLIDFEEFAALEGHKPKDGVVYFGENLQARNDFFIKG